MRTNMARIPSLAYDPSIRPNSAIGINLVPAISLIVLLTLLTVKTRVYLRPNSHSFPNFDERYFGTNFESFADDLVAYAKREVLGSPAAGDGVDITTANTAGVDLDVDIVVAKRLWGELSSFRVDIVIMDKATYFTFVEASPRLG